MNALGGGVDFGGQVESALADVADPRDVAGAVKALGSAGVFRRRWSADHGSGLSMARVIATRATRSSVGLAHALLTHGEVFTAALQWWGARTGDQRDLLDAALDGAVVGCFAVTGATHGSSGRDPRSRMRMLGPPASSARIRVDATKPFVSNAAGSTHALVACEADGGLALVSVPLQHEGVTVGPDLPALGPGTCPTQSLDVHAVLPASAVVGRFATSAGAGQLHRLFALERLAIAAQLVEVSRAAMRLCLDAGGRVDGRLVDATTSVAAANALLDRAITDGGMPRAATAAKIAALRAATAALDACLSTGVADRTATEQLVAWRADIRLAEIGGGVSEALVDSLSSRLDRYAPPGRAAAR